MNRGMLSSIIDNKAYKESDKEWIVGLQLYHMYWYDLIVTPEEISKDFNSKKEIVSYLKSLKKIINDNLEKHFVYFICSRKKVRFNTSKAPSYNPFTKKVKIHFLIGTEEIKKAISIQFLDNNNKSYKPIINFTNKYITITFFQGNSMTCSIHDFLEMNNIDLGIYSKVEYVGYTKNPHQRPTKSQHEEFSHILYKNKEENNDIFIYFNIFKVITQAINKNYMLNFTLANAMTNEIDVKREAKILEKCFICYFDSENQSMNKRNEITELKNNLLNIATENRISDIQIRYEPECSNDYNIFYSANIEPKSAHIFTVEIANEDIKITNNSKFFKNFPYF